MDHNKGLIVGFQSLDGVKNWRLDYDDFKESHINFKNGKETGAILIENFKASISLIQDQWTKKFK